MSDYTDAVEMLVRAVEDGDWDDLHLLAQIVRQAGVAEGLPDPVTTPQPGAYHSAGPATEREAYQRFAIPRAGTLRELVLDRLFIAGANGLTDRELSRETDKYLYSIAPRRTELLHMGWVKDSGVRRPTNPHDPTGPQGVVWVLTEEGTELWGRHCGARAI